MRHDRIDKAFWAEGPGAFHWQIEDGQEALLLLVPWIHDEGRSRGQLLHLFTERSSNDWNQEGPVHAWDGNFDEPTLTGSIQAITCIDSKVVAGWHGWLRAGKLEPAGA